MSNPQEKTQPIAEKQLQALLQSLMTQRNSALNALAQSEANLAMAQARVEELEQKLAEAEVPKA